MENAMIKCISYWSIKGGPENTRPIDEALAEAQAAGFVGLELAIAQKGIITPDTPESDCLRIREQIQRSGLTVQTLASGMSWGCCPSHPDAAVRQRSIQLHHAALQ